MKDQEDRGCAQIQVCMMTKGAEDKVRKPWRVRGQGADGYLGKKGKDSETAKPLKKKKGK